MLGFGPDSADEDFPDVGALTEYIEARNGWGVDGEPGGGEIQWPRGGGGSVDTGNGSNGAFVDWVDEQ